MLSCVSSAAKFLSGFSWTVSLGLLLVNRANKAMNGCSLETEFWCGAREELPTVDSFIRQA